MPGTYSSMPTTRADAIKQGAKALLDCIEAEKEHIKRKMANDPGHHTKRRQARLEALETLAGKAQNIAESQCGNDQADKKLKNEFNQLYLEIRASNKTYHDRLTDASKAVLQKIQARFVVKDSLLTVKSSVHINYEDVVREHKEKLQPPTSSQSIKKKLLALGASHTQPEDTAYPQKK